MQATRPPRNHLADEKSPYLRQHAGNPVDWYPWGGAAFAKAVREDKPILLSVGYSTCHWCHVMEAESFSDPRVAAVMNRGFVNVKVDREERPDVDHIYMTALSVFSVRGGWPLNVFLTPGGRPFFGGTYFPPAPKPGLPGWTDLLARIDAVWRDPEQRPRLLASADEVTDTLAAVLAGTPRPAGTIDVKRVSELFAAERRLYASRFDPREGGFGRAPKFPMPSMLHFLMADHDLARRFRTPPEEAERSLQMALKTLRSIAAGGVHDHIGGGFHRYATDDRWHLPHFEKMLYDNAQLIAAFVAAFRSSGDGGFLETAKGAADYLLRDMTHPDGGFYSAEDADSPASAADPRKTEGAFYVWTMEEVRALLGPDDAALCAHRYGLRTGGNVAVDPHGEFAGRNVPYAAHSPAQTAAHFGLTPEEALRRLSSVRKRLFAARALRPRPHLDDKILSSWNGLTIAALAALHRAGGGEGYLSAARRAARFVRDRLYDAETGRLHHRWRQGDRRVDGFAADYAFLVHGLLELFSADGDPSWLEWAAALSEEQLAAFGDPAGGGFYMTRDGHDPHLIVRPREETDNVLPSAASVSARNLLRLHRATGRRRFEEAALGLLRAAVAGVERHPGSAPRMLISLGAAVADLCGENGDAGERGRAPGRRGRSGGRLP